MPALAVEPTHILGMPRTEDTAYHWDTVHRLDDGLQRALDVAQRACSRAQAHPQLLQRHGEVECLQAAHHQTRGVSG